MHHRSPAEVLQALNAGPDGLSAADAAARLREHGPNAFPEQKRSWVQLVIRQFDDVLVWVLFAALALSVLLPFVEHGGVPEASAFVDAGVIGGILVVNALLGIVQEFRAESAIAALKRLSTPEVVVRRDGTDQRVPNAEVVPGDLLVLEAGDRVAADARLVKSAHLQAGESMLTGESVPVDKGVEAVAEDAPVADRASLVFAGTLVTKGAGEAVVISTGLDTETGRIARLVMDAEAPKTPLELQLAALGRVLAFAALGVCVFVVSLGLARSLPALDLLLVGVSLAVSAVPEGLPAVVTVCFAVGMQRMAGQGALVRRLDSLETLGAVTVIATDKTGTLTRNQMQVVEHWVDTQGEDDLLAQIGLSCNHATGEVGDPTETALVAFGTERGVERLPIDEDVVPFTSEQRYMSTRHEGQRFWKGAPERIVALCGYEDPDVIAMAREMAARGRRVLAGAVGKPDQMRVVGLWGLEDPPRKGVKEAIALAATAGVRTVMLTGDHVQTARAIGRQVGIHGRAMSGQDLDALSKEELVEVVGRVSVFGRVSPEHKVAICRALQADGQVVAMTGDGVNDAPALRTAHVGVAMGKRGTEVAREAAAIVLADDHYATIVTAVSEGRRIHDNIRRFVLFLLRANFDELLLITVAITVDLPIPYLPVHILWMNLLTDGIPALALAAEPAEPDVMERPPRDPTEHLLTHEWGRLIFATLVCAAVTFGYYAWLLQSDTELQLARSATLSLALVLELILAYSARSHLPVWRISPVGNPWLLAAIGSVGTLHLALLYLPMGRLLHLVPITLDHWIPILGLAGGAFALFELSKLLDDWPWGRARGRSPAGPTRR